MLKLHSLYLSTKKLTAMEIPFKKKVPLLMIISPAMKVFLSKSKMISSATEQNHLKTTKYQILIMKL